MTSENINSGFTQMADKGVGTLDDVSAVVSNLISADSICARRYMGDRSYSSENSINRARAALVDCWGDAVVVMLASDSKLALAGIESARRPANLATRIELSDHERLEGLKIHGYSRLESDEDPSGALSFLFDLQAIDPKLYATARTALV